MTEKRIKELAEEFWQKNYVNGGCQPIWTAVLGYARTVAAEAQEEGIEEMRDAARKRCEQQAKYYRENTMYPSYCLNGMESGAKACAELMGTEAAKLLVKQKEQG